MKWIIIASSNNKKNFDFLNDFFYKYNTSLSFYDVSSGMTEEKKLEIYQDLKCATNVLLLNAKEMISNPEIMYIAGIVRGKEIPFFVVGYDPNDKVPAEFSDGILFKDFAAVVKDLEEQLPIYIKEEQKKNAIDELYNRGITFTTDSFAHEIEMNNIEICKLFLMAGMDINSVCEKGVPMICHAARRSNKKTMQWLLASGADIDAISADRGYSAVMDAVWKANDDLVELLCEKGANLDFISRDGQSVLVLAIGGPSPRICDILIAHGANPYIKDKMGMSAYDYAKLFKQTHLLELINAQKEKEGSL